MRRARAALVRRARWLLSDRRTHRPSPDSANEGRAGKRPCPAWARGEALKSAIDRQFGGPTPRDPDAEFGGKDVASTVDLAGARCRARVVTRAGAECSHARTEVFHASKDKERLRRKRGSSGVWAPLTDAELHGFGGGGGGSSGAGGSHV